MANNASGSGSASMSISSDSQRSNSDGQDPELYATVTSTEIARTQAHDGDREASAQSTPAGESDTQGVTGDIEEGHETDLDASDFHERRPSGVSVSPDNASKDAVKYEPAGSQRDDELGTDKTALPASSFEDAINRSARSALAVSDKEISDSESDSEDILVGPRNSSQHNSANANETPRSRSSIVESGGKSLRSKSLSPSHDSDKPGAEDPEDTNDPTRSRPSIMGSAAAHPRSQSSSSPHHSDERSAGDPEDTNDTPGFRPSIMGSGAAYHRSRSSSPSQNSDEPDAEDPENREDNIALSEDDESKSIADAQEGDEVSSEGDESESNASGQSSRLSDLGDTLEPTDPQLAHLASQQKRAELSICKCEGWCFCEKYNIFFGFGPSEMAQDAPRDMSAQDHAKDKSAGTKGRAPAADAENEEDENVFENPSSSPNDSVGGSDNKQDKTESSEEDFDEFPSQTHLNERVLASEEFEVSDMRSSTNKGKRRSDFEDEVNSKRPRTKQVFSWDRLAKPSRPPASWTGGAWTDAGSKATSPPREIEDSEDEVAGEEVQI